MLNCTRALIAMALALPLLAQPVSPQPARAPAKRASTPVPAKPTGLTVDAVVAMVDAGLSDDVIIARLRKEDKAFDLSPDDLIRLKKAKVSDMVMKLMLDPKTELTPLTAVKVTSPDTPVPSRPPAPPAEVKPAPAPADPNDPLSPHESGVYLYARAREGAPQLVALQRAPVQGAKAGGFFTSSLTYGIKKAKTKAVIPGPHSSIQTNEASPVFYFYFDESASGKSNFVSNLSNPGQFYLLRLEVTKSDRETTTGQFGLGTASTGTDTKAMIQFRSEKVGMGVYKVAVDGLQSGEYCFMASNAAGQASAGIFDFGVTIE